MQTVRVTILPEQDGAYLLRVELQGDVETVGPVLPGVPALAVFTEAKMTPTKEHIRKRSNKQERYIAKVVGGRIQPGSGSSSRAKGDVQVLGKLRLEAKFTYSDNYILKLEVLRKIQNEAGPGEEACLQVDFVDKTTNRTTDSWILVHAPNMRPRSTVVRTTYRSYQLSVQGLRELLNKTPPNRTAGLIIQFVRAVDATITDEWLCVPFQDWQKEYNERHATNDRRPT